MFVRGKVRNMPGLTGLGRLRGRGRKLGCSACSGKRLGQEDIADWASGNWSGDTTAPVFGPPAPTPAQITYDQTVASGSVPNPLYNFQPLPSAGVPSISFSLPSLPTLSVPTIPVLNNPASSPLSTGTLQTSASPLSSASNYLPYVILGFGALAVVVVMKKRH